LELLDTVGIKAPGCLASFILTENSRMTPHLLKSDVPFKSNSKSKVFFFFPKRKNVCPFVCGLVCIPS